MLIRARSCMTQVTWIEFRSRAASRRQTSPEPAYHQCKISIPSRQWVILTLILIPSLITDGRWRTLGFWSSFLFWFFWNKLKLLSFDSDCPSRPELDITGRIRGYEYVHDVSVAIYFTLEVQHTSSSLHRGYAARLPPVTALPAQLEPWAQRWQLELCKVPVPCPGARPKTIGSHKQ